ncbi:MAG: hypothetical protein MJ252_20915, partial [archaeon]|nr:hypothetical protein [archaeon]
EEKPKNKEEKENDDKEDDGQLNNEEESEPKPEDNKPPHILYKISKTEEDNKESNIEEPIIQTEKNDNKMLININSDSNIEKEEKNKIVKLARKIENFNQKPKSPEAKKKKEIKPTDPLKDQKIRDILFKIKEKETEKPKEISEQKRIINKIRTINNEKDQKNKFTNALNKVSSKSSKGTLLKNNEKNKDTKPKNNKHISIIRHQKESSIEKKPKLDEIKTEENKEEKVVSPLSTNNKPIINRNLELNNLEELDIIGNSPIKTDDELLIEKIRDSETKKLETEGEENNDLENKDEHNDDLQNIQEDNPAKDISVPQINHLNQNNKIDQDTYKRPVKSECKNDKEINKKKNPITTKLKKINPIPPLGSPKDSQEPKKYTKPIIKIGKPIAPKKNNPSKKNKKDVQSISAEALIEQQESKKNNPLLNIKPKPIQTNIKKTNPIETIERNKIENILSKITYQSPKDLNKLVKVLGDSSSNCTNAERAFLSYLWVVSNIKYSFNKVLEMSNEEVFKEKSTNSLGFSNIFKFLTQSLGVENVSIPGYSNFFKSEEEDNSQNHFWNAIRLEGKWFLVDTVLGAGEVKKETKEFIQRRDDYYFCVNPNEFKYTHLPSELTWQLSDNVFEPKVFFDCVPLRPFFFQSGFTSLEPSNKDLYEKEYLKCILSYDPEKEKEVNIICRLKNLNEANTETEKKKKEQIDPESIVRVEKDSQHSYFTIELLFHQEGKYIAEILQRKRDGEYTKLYEYNIKCNKCLPIPIMFPKVFPTLTEISDPKANTLIKGKKVKFKVKTKRLRGVSCLEDCLCFDLKPKKESFEDDIFVCTDSLVLYYYDIKENKLCFLSYYECKHERHSDPVSFPMTFISPKVKLIEPKCNTLYMGETIKFQLESAEMKKIFVNVGAKSIPLKKNKDGIFEKEIIIDSEFVTVSCPDPEKEDDTLIFIEYIVEI